MGKKYAVIVAGGSGIRAGGEIPKQFQMLCGLPVVWWSVRAFYHEDPEVKIRIVLHPGFFDLWDILYSELPEEEKRIKVELVCGGRSRLESVKNGIMGIEPGVAEETLIAVHDAARPLVSRELISRGWEAAKTSGAAIPVVPMTDSIRRLTADGSVALDRSKYVRVQTPQVFYADLLKDAYSRELTPEMTDDASVAEAAGTKVALFEGSEANIKITNPIDFKIAALLMNDD
ncbi:MAG: 2-C-methyl-D-erythritol 4-phosphate cytidylyltransferase [Muribaculaceae bacterium]|nr:2-C-methyl-D-erythritol 4-phosphate cytidylyltransferase [Muribaculaceae bacterium]